MVWSRAQGNRNPSAAGDFLDWKRRATAFQSLNAWTGGSVNLATSNRPEQVSASTTTPGFLSMTGTPIAQGRDFLPEEGQVGCNQVVILTHRLWQERFAGDPAIVGRQIRVDAKPYTVVGVLAAGQADRMQSRIYLPLAFAPDQINHDFRWLLVMGRLKPGISIAQANAEMEAVTRKMAEAYPASNRGWSASVEPLKNNFLSQETKTALWLLLGAVGSRPGAGFSMVSPEYYRTFGIEMIKGRAFTSQDRAGSLRVAIVNERFVKRYLPGRDPLTQRLRVAPMVALRQE